MELNEEILTVNEITVKEKSKKAIYSMLIFEKSFYLLQEYNIYIFRGILTGEKLVSHPISLLIFNIKGNNIKRK